jgi:hypothetical protein
MQESRRAQRDHGFASHARRRSLRLLARDLRRFVKSEDRDGSSNDTTKCKTSEGKLQHRTPRVLASSQADRSKEADTTEVGWVVGNEAHMHAHLPWGGKFTVLRKILFIVL